MKKQTGYDKNIKEDSNKILKKPRFLGRFFTFKKTTHYDHPSNSDMNNIAKMDVETNINRNPRFKAINRFYRDPFYKQAVEENLLANMNRQIHGVNIDKKYFSQVFDEIMRLMESKKELEKKKEEVLKLEKDIDIQKQNIVNEKKQSERDQNKLIDEINTLKDNLNVFQNKLTELIKEINSKNEEKNKVIDGLNNSNAVTLFVMHLLKFFR